MNRLTIGFLVVIVAIVAAFDVWTLAARGYDTTISWQLWLWSHDWPIIPFTFGVFAGHLFFPNRAAKPGAPRKGKAGRPQVVR